MAESIESVGDGGTRTTLALWESNNQADITAAGSNVDAVAECIGSGNNLNLGTGTTSPGTARVDFTGWTTDATHRVVVRAQAGSEHLSTGVLDRSKAFIETSIGGGNGVLFPRIDFTLQNMQVVLNPLAASAGAKCVYLSNVSEPSRSVIIENCLFIVNMDLANAFGQDGNFFELRGPTSQCIIRNNIFVLNGNGSTGSFSSCYIQGNASPGTFVHQFHNNTVIVRDKPTGSTVLFSIVGGDEIDSNNNYLYRDGEGVVTGNIYNANSPATLTKGAGDVTSNTEATTVGNQSVAYSTDNFTNVTPGSEDLTPVAGSGVVDAGVDLTSVGITDDVLGTARPQGSAFDAGAIELPQAAMNAGGDTMKLLRGQIATTAALDNTNEGDVLMSLDNMPGTALAFTVSSTVVAGGGGFSTILVEVQYSIDNKTTWLTSDTDSIYTSTTDDVTVTSIAAVKGTDARVVAKTITESGGTPTITLQMEARIM